jgi:hypothetical protein
MKSPYEFLQKKNFWKLSVPDSADSVEDMYIKRFSISGKRIATAGSCFAQEIARELRKRGHILVDKEPSPGTLEIRGDIEQKYGYGLYSARHGNIYTARQLLQLSQEAFGVLRPSPDEYVWTRDDRFFDALRPSVEPNGLSSIQEVVLQRLDHVRRFKQVLLETDIFIFTLGLTEAWENIKSGLIYPTAPGTIAGDFSDGFCKFVNFGFADVYNDFIAFRNLVKDHNKNIKFIITVSPVPLTATASNDHVLVATVRSKSVLRAVAAQLYDEFNDVDYFPSYEIFSTPFLGGSLFKENKRNVTRSGVAAAMKVFFGQHSSSECLNGTEAENDSSVCEDALLDAFAGDKK